MQLTLTITDSPSLTAEALNRFIQNAAEDGLSPETALANIIKKEAFRKRPFTSQSGRAPMPKKKGGKAA